MNDTKKIGRPRSFDRDEALEAAMNVFWTKGFDGASIRTLTEAMGINGPSLYATYGDKENLYQQTVDLYMKDYVCVPIILFEQEENIEKAVRLFMESAVTLATDGRFGARGCYISSCVAIRAGESETSRKLMKKNISDSEKRLTHRLQVEKEKGGLAKTFPCETRARLMCDLRQGFIFRARAGHRKEDLLKDLNHSVQLVLHH